jgi:hypothetical protein
MFLETFISVGPFDFGIRLAKIRRVEIGLQRFAFGGVNESATLGTHLGNRRLPRLSDYTCRGTKRGRFGMIRNSRLRDNQGPLFVVQPVILSSAIFPAETLFLQITGRNIDL